MADPRKVRAMFGRIARRYDLLNRLLSAGADRRWRREAVLLAGDVQGRVVVDSCCGTGDLARAFGGAGARVVGVDFTPEMLRAARGGGPPGGLLVRGDALNLPLGGQAADVSSIAFGLRNVADRARCLLEMARVLRPGGLVLVLEFGRPRRRLPRALFHLYFTRVLPRVGGWISGDREAYRYLPDTVLAWPDADELLGEMEGLGLVGCGYRPLTGGIAYVHWGRVGER